MSRLKAGERFGRWQVVGYAPPKRVGAETYKRACVTVVCVCGVRQRALECDLKRSRTLGCRSSRCRSRWDAMNHVREMLGEHLDRAFIGADDG